MEYNLFTIDEFMSREDKIRKIKCNCIYVKLNNKQLLYPSSIYHINEFVDTMNCSGCGKAYLIDNPEIVKNTVYQKQYNPNDAANKHYRRVFNLL